MRDSALKDMLEKELAERQNILKARAAVLKSKIDSSRQELNVADSADGS